MCTFSPKKARNSAEAFVVLVYFILFYLAIETQPHRSPDEWYRTFRWQKRDYVYDFIVMVFSIVVLFIFSPSFAGLFVCFVIALLFPFSSSDHIVNVNLVI